MTFYCCRMLSKHQWVRRNGQKDNWYSKEVTRLESERIMAHRALKSSHPQSTVLAYFEPIKLHHKLIQRRAL